jgi:hypothetical protein
MTRLDDATVSDRARRLAGALEPFAGQVYFSPECHANYERLGFTASPGDANGVALPDGPAYFTSRGSVMGQVAGEVVAAAFAVFNPAIVVPLVDVGWSMTDATTIRDARRDGATAQLERILGEEPEGLARATELLDRANEGLRPEGRPLFAGLLSNGRPGNPMGDAWHLADRLREYRGDSHTAAWITADIDATEIGLMTELFWGLPMRSYVRSRAWSNDELDDAEARLVDRGWVADGGFTDAGRAAREHVEAVTDRQCRPIIENLGDDHAELVGILEPWGAAIRDAKGYLGLGPHDLARETHTP